MNYKSPLNCYVIWHPLFKDGEKYANEIYSLLCRDSNIPLQRGIGIPVFYRSEPLVGTKVPIAIPTESAKRNALIILIDDEMFNDKAWEDYIIQILDLVNQDTRVYPVALSKYAFYLNEVKLNEYQFIRLFEVTQFNEKWSILKHALLHDLSRQMVGLISSSENQNIDISPPVKIFLSHAKVDGESIAMKFRSYIANNTKLNKFFDTNDIADGFSFKGQIHKNLLDSAVVVFLTDEYSNREWCRIEVIVAKRYKSPLVVVQDIQNGEKRSFPYMGNVPTVRFKGKFDEIIDLTLLQVLNNRFVKEKLQSQLDLYGIEKHFDCSILSSPPELFNLIDLVKEKGSKNRLIIYPDPPIGIEELELLNDFDQNLKFITPIMLSEII
jgi:hypothetical protein